MRVCRDCGEEYRPEIVRCADCGGELEDRYPGERGLAAGAADAAARRPSSPAIRVLFMTPRATDLVPMAERLREVAIEHRLAEQPGTVEGAPPRYAMLVREADAGRRSQPSPTSSRRTTTGRLHAVETRFDPERGYLQCPACGPTRPPGATECPECGLGSRAARTAAEEPRE